MPYKKIIVLTFSLTYNLFMSSQTDLTASLFNNGDFEKGIHVDWQLELKGNAKANYLDAGKLESAYGGHAAKVVVTQKHYMHHVALKKVIVYKNICGKAMTYSIKASALENGMSSIMRVNAYSGNSEIIDYAQTQMWLERDGLFKVYSLTFTIPLNTKYLELLVWCGAKKGTYLFDDFTVNR